VILLRTSDDYTEQQILRLLIPAALLISVYFVIVQSYATHQHNQNGDKFHHQTVSLQELSTKL